MGGLRLTHEAQVCLFHILIRSPGIGPTEIVRIRHHRRIQNMSIGGVNGGRRISSLPSDMDSRPSRQLGRQSLGFVFDVQLMYNVVKILHEQSKTITA